MYALGFSLDNRSLMALTLGVGLVVDDAIVMLENIVRRLEMGKDRATSCAGRRPRGRVHHPIDDPFAHGSVIPVLFMPGVVRKLSRVRRYHQYRHPGLRRGLAVADPDAREPGPWQGANRGTGGTMGRPSGSSKPSSAYTGGAWVG